MQELLQVFVENIVPILAIAGVGVLAHRYLHIPVQPLSTMVFYILSPALVFWSLYTSTIGGDELLTIVVLQVALHLIMALIGYVAATLLGARDIQRANTTLAAFTLNAGNYGLSLIGFAFGAEVLSRAVVIYVVHTAVVYSLGVFVASSGRGSAQDALISLARTPVIYAVMAALICVGFGIDLPIALERTASTLADATIPILLLMLGIQLGQFTRLKHIRLLVTGVSLGLLVTPLIATLIATLFNLGDAARTAFIVQAAMPTAIATLVLSTEFDLDRELALNFIFITTLLSPFTLSVLITLLQ